MRYQTEEGWSPQYQVQCNYTTGTELNTATVTLNYQAFAIYAVIFWAQSEASIIQMNGIFVCGFEAKNGCASTAYIPVHGTDQRGRAWMVCSPTILVC